MRSVTPEGIVWVPEIAPSLRRIIFFVEVEAAAAEGNKEKAQAALTEAAKVIEKAANKGVYHKNNAARKVSRCAKIVNGIA